MENYKEIYHNGHLVGVDIIIGDETIFLDAPISVSNEEVRNFVNQIINDEDLSIIESGHIKTSKGVILQIGKILEGDISYTSASTKISGDITPNSRMMSLRDGGTIGKSKWRFELLQFGKNVFPEGIVPGSGVVFMPGIGKDEFHLWKNFGVHSRDMTFIEGDDDKMVEIQRKYQNNGSTPSYINSYLGLGDEVFSQELIESLGEKNVSVLSLDTESRLSKGLYKDLLGIFSNIVVKKDLLLMLNIVGRGSTKFSKTLSNSEENSNDKIDEAMQKIPKNLLLDSKRDDLTVSEIKTGAYLGGSSTAMHFVFAHIKKV